MRNEKAIGNTKLTGTPPPWLLWDIAWICCLTLEHSFEYTILKAHARTEGAFNMFVKILFDGSIHLHLLSIIQSILLILIQIFGPFISFDLLAESLRHGINFFEFAYFRIAFLVQLLQNAINCLFLIFGTFDLHQFI